MIDKPIDSITSADIASLIENRASEGRSLEYKQELPKGSDEGRKEFLADLASFANTSGGHILFGVSEQRDSAGRATGIPEEAIGLQGNLDAETLGLESVVRDGIEPRIPGVVFRSIPDFKLGPVLVCWIPKSWHAPHMVTYRGSSRFFARSGSGKYQLDVPQIRAAFLGSETLRESIRRFRQEQIARIASNDAPLPLHGSRRVILHVAPVVGFDPTQQTLSMIDVAKTHPLPLFGRCDHYRHNLDGFLGYTLASDKLCGSYVQVFRSGIIEGVDTEVIDGDQIPHISFEEELIRSLAGYLNNLKAWGLSGPFLIMLSLAGFKGVRMTSEGAWYRVNPGAIDRDVVVVPETWLEQIDGPPEQVAIRALHEPLDVLWQAAGWEKSPNFNAAGEWRPHRRR